MDIEYLQNVMGSPYINEGAFDRLKAKGAQAMGSLGVTMGHQIQNPTETRIRSLWEGFMSSLKRVMTDWKNQVSPMFGSEVSVDENGQRIKDALDSLAQTITIQFQPVNSFNPNYNIDSPRNPRDNPETYGKPSDAAKLKTLTKEGLWDAAKRDMGLNKSLGSNDPNAILDSYKNHVLTLFKKFMKDAVKSTKLPAQQIYSVLAKIQPQKGGWQSAGNMQKVVKQLQSLQSTPSASPYSGPTPPVLPIAGTQQNSPLAKPPVIQQPQTSSSPPSSAATPPSPSPATPSSQISSSSSGNSVPTENDFKISPEEMPYVILKAFKLIVDAVKSDEGHAMGLFGVDPHTKAKTGYPKLETTWDVAPLASLQEVHVDDPKNMGYIDPEISSKAEENDKIFHKEYPGEFLYNFHSRFNKFPSQPFSIRVEGPNESPDIKDNNGNVIASVEVWWQSTGTVNKIYVVEVKNKMKSQPALVLRFSDHHVSAKAGASTPGDINFFNLDNVVQKSNPDAYSSMESSSVKAEIEKMKNDIFRCLLVTTHRKSMEFVSQGWKEKKAEEKANAQVKAEKQTSEVGDDGTLTYVDNLSGQQVTVNAEQIEKILKGPLIPAKIMRKRLDEFGYSAKFSIPPPAHKTQIWKDSNMALITLGFTKNKADKLLADAWIYIKENSPTASIWPEDSDITGETFVTAALKKKPTSTESPKKSPTNTPDPSKHVPPTTGGLPTTTPVSAPVSGGVSAPVGTPVSAPVSNADKAAKETPKSQGGQVSLKDDEIVWEHPKTHEVFHISADQIEKIAKKQPKLVQALKANPDVYNKFKSSNQANPKGEKKPKIQERIDYINPFSSENFL